MRNSPDRLNLLDGDTLRGLHRLLAVSLVGASFLILCGLFLNLEQISAFLVDRAIVPATIWIPSHIGFPNTMAALRSFLTLDNTSLFLRVGIVCGALVVILLGILNGLCSNFVLTRKHYRLVFLLACINSVCFPLGFYVGMKTFAALRHPPVIEQFMFRNSSDRATIDWERASEHALLEVIRMPNPFHIGLVLTFLHDDATYHRTVWINGWFGLSIPISVTTTVTKQSPYFLPFIPTSGPFLINRERALKIEAMAIFAEKFLHENKKPYSFVPGVLDGCWPLFAGGGHTSNNVVASLLHWSGVVREIVPQYGRFRPWSLAPGGNPNKERNIMPLEWFQA